MSVDRLRVILPGGELVPGVTTRSEIDRARNELSPGAAFICDRIPDSVLWLRPLKTFFEKIELRARWLVANHGEDDYIEQMRWDIADCLNGICDDNEPWFAFDEILYLTVTPFVKRRIEDLCYRWRKYQQAERALRDMAHDAPARQLEEWVEVESPRSDALQVPGTPQRTIVEQAPQADGRASPVLPPELDTEPFAIGEIDQSKEPQVKALGHFAFGRSSEFHELLSRVLDIEIGELVADKIRCGCRRFFRLRRMVRELELKAMCQEWCKTAEFYAIQGVGDDSSIVVRAVVVALENYLRTSITGYRLAEIIERRMGIRVSPRLRRRFRSWQREWAQHIREHSTHGFDDSVDFLTPS